MSPSFKGWATVAREAEHLCKEGVSGLNAGQQASVRGVVARMQHNGVIIADEVGMGKTRIAAAIARAVIKAGGRVAVLVPPGLGFQWRGELRAGGIDAPGILRSLKQYFERWESQDEPQPWFDESLVIISHAFTNWRLGAGSAAWRWALLPALYGRWKKQVTGIWPKGYRRHVALTDPWPWVQHASQSIVDMAWQAGESHSAYRQLESFVELAGSARLLEPSEYSTNGSLRCALESAVGLGLGAFDLVIIDEAHKSRDHESCLSRLIENVIQVSGQARRLAMTATPVELDAEQWRQTLTRIKAEEEETALLAIGRYAAAVRKVRQCPNDEQARLHYEGAARGFKKVLDPYLLRRDKREDPWVRAFRERVGDPAADYRLIEKVSVEMAGLPPAWKKAICAVEALSFVSSQADDPVSKRLRLTVGNGHGIAALIDQMTHGEDDGGTREETASAAVAEPDAKRLARARQWQASIRQALGNIDTGDHALYEHPAILAAVSAIEETLGNGEKVLVFGRFNRPLQALARLLNAREMLRCLDQGIPWPESKASGDDFVALQAAHHQMGRVGELGLDEINAKLGKQYEYLREERRRVRDHLIANIEQGKSVLPAQAHAMFQAFRQEVAQGGQAFLDGEDRDEHVLALVARAVQELLPAQSAATPEPYALAFAELVGAAGNHDHEDDDGNDESATDRVLESWQEFTRQLTEEFARPEGRFARLMNGNTKPGTRRFLQLAFNREHAWPKVLVAQSAVGREGLNLHKACRTVVLLHPEWNPAVVEQQIGRVDRLGSLWEKKLKEAIERGEPSEQLPRIHVRPIVFEGTYDEMNWEVLRERWDDLRAQLHGVVIPEAAIRQVLGMHDVASAINAAAPRFSPMDA